jgi:hypothetical protein
MDLHFITSLSKEYWDSVGQYCIGTWDLPGKVTIYLEQTSGPIKWVESIPYNVELLNVPLLITSNDNERRKVLKFWGKTSAQVQAVTSRRENERVIWLDSDIEQIGPVNHNLFDFNFLEAVATLNSGDSHDCWESGIVIFNQNNIKLHQFIKKYSQAWNDENILNSLWKPYDAQVLGYVASIKGYYNLCNKQCLNVEALNNSQYRNCFKHWINKENKEELKKLHEKFISSNVPQIDTKS